MDYPQSEAWERQVAAKVMGVFAPLRAARTIDDVDRGTVNLQANLEAALDDAFDKIYEQAIIFILLWMMSEDPGYQPFLDDFRRDPRLAADLGTAQARRVASEIADSTRRRVIEYRAKPKRDLPVEPAPSPSQSPAIDPDFDQWRDAVFGQGRAEAIGITETTEAISQAETQAAAIVTNSTSPHALHGTWVTAEDERVCPICAPLHDQPMEVYTRTFPSGPPAHPRCRCRIRWAVRQLQESTVRPMKVARRMLLSRPRDQPPPVRRSS